MHGRMLLYHTFQHRAHWQLHVLVCLYKIYQFRNRSITPATGKIIIHETAACISQPHRNQQFVYRQSCNCPLLHHKDEGACGYLPPRNQEDLFVIDRQACWKELVHLSSKENESLKDRYLNISFLFSLTLRKACHSFPFGIGMLSAALIRLSRVAPIRFTRVCFFQTLFLVTIPDCVYPCCWRTHFIFHEW